MRNLTIKNFFLVIWIIEYWYLEFVCNLMPEHLLFYWLHFIQGCKPLYFPGPINGYFWDGFALAADERLRNLNP